MNQGRHQQKSSFSSQKDPVFLSPYNGFDSINSSPTNFDQINRITDNKNSISTYDDNRSPISGRDTTKSKFENISTMKVNLYESSQIEDYILKSPTKKPIQNIQFSQNQYDRQIQLTTENSNTESDQMIQSNFEPFNLNTRHKRNQAANNLQGQYEGSPILNLDDSKINDNSPFNLVSTQNNQSSFLKAGKKLNSKVIQLDNQQTSQIQIIKTEEDVDIQKSGKSGKQQTMIFQNLDQSAENSIKQRSCQHKNGQEYTLNKQRVNFVENFEYFYFDPKIKINNLNKQEGSVCNQKKQDDPKKILKKNCQPKSIEIQLEDQEQQKPKIIRKQKSSNSFKQIIKMDNNQQKSMPIQSNTSMKSDIDIQEEKNEENKSQINKLDVGTPQSRINLRQRQGLILSDSVQQLPNSGLINKLQINNKFNKLNEYEKANYMRRASDINRLIEFQKRNSNQFHKKTSRILKKLFQFILQIISLKIFNYSISSSFCWISYSTNQIHAIFFNLNIVSVFALLYSMIELYLAQTDQSDVFQRFFNYENQLVTYTGHFFILIFILGFIRFTQQIKDFSVSEKEKHGFKLIFTNYRWNGKTYQLNCLANKGRWVDQIYENIDTFESYEFVKHVLAISIYQLIAIIINISSLFFILDDYELLETIQNNISSQTFLNRLIVAFATSILILFNNYSINLLFIYFKQVKFSYYEKNKLYLLYFNQMMILIIYQIKSMAYLNSDYQSNFIRIKQTESYEISYINLVLIISEVTIQMIERLIFIIISITQQSKNKDKSNSQVIPILNNQIENQIVENRSKSESQSNQLNPKTKIINLNKEDFEEDGEKKEIIKTEYSEVRLNTQTTDAENKTKQNLITSQKFSSKMKSNKTISNIFSVQKESGNKVNNSFRLMKSVVFIISINYLVISNIVIQPSIIIIGFVINILFLIITSCEINKAKNFISLLDYSQYNTIIYLISFISLLVSFFFNFAVGFNLKSQNHTEQTILEDEFSYLNDIKRINQIIKIITQPYLLLPIIVLLSVLLYQSNQYQKSHDTIQRDGYYRLKQTINRKQD